MMFPSLLTVGIRMDEAEQVDLKRSDSSQTSAARNILFEHAMENLPSSNEAKKHELTDAMARLIPSDDAAEIILQAHPETSNELLDTLHKIDMALPENDGLRWFNKLYIEVSEKVKEAPPNGGWQDPAWLEKLDVNFGNLYLDALKANLKGQKVPEAWKALFDSRHDTGIEPIQLALAGMVAHIDHDLSYALSQTNKDFGINPGSDSPQHADFDYVNNVLAQIVPEAVKELNKGALGNLAEHTGAVGDWLAMANISEMRDVAWSFSKRIGSESKIERSLAEHVQDNFSGSLASLILVPNFVL